MRAIEIAKAKRKRLLEDIKRAEAEIKKLDEFLQMAETLEHEAAEPSFKTLTEQVINLTDELTSKLTPPKGLVRRSPLLRRGHPPSIRERVEAFVGVELVTYGARSTKELLESLLKSGIDPAPSVSDIGDKRNALSTMLSKADVFKNDKDARVWRIDESKEKEYLNIKYSEWAKTLTPF